MSPAIVRQVNLAVPEKSDAKNVGITGINKQPVEHPVAVRAPGPKRTGLHSGLVGDQIFDIDHHGGDDQAVYAYAREDYDWWEQELGRELPGGIFGENLTTAGLDVNGAELGETWAIGDDLVLQTTFGRIPCATSSSASASSERASLPSNASTCASRHNWTNGWAGRASRSSLRASRSRPPVIAIPASDTAQVDRMESHSAFS